MMFGPDVNEVFIVLLQQMLPELERAHTSTAFYQ